MLFFQAINLLSQDIASLEAKNQKLETKINTKNREIQSLNTSLEKSKEEVNYLKETLGLINSKIESENQGITFKISSVEGDSDQGTVKIKGLLENIGSVSNFQVIHINIVDPKGNEYISHNVKLGSNKSMIIDFQKNVPLSFVFTIESIIEEFLMVKAMTINFYNRKGFTDKNPNIIFKNLEVSWK